MWLTIAVWRGTSFWIKITSSLRDRFFRPIGLYVCPLTGPMMILSVASLYDLFAQIFRVVGSSWDRNTMPRYWPKGVPFVVIVNFVFSFQSFKRSEDEFEDIFGEEILFPFDSCFSTYLHFRKCYRYSSDSLGEGNKKYKSRGYRHLLLWIFHRKLNRSATNANERSAFYHDEQSALCTVIYWKMSVRTVMQQGK